MKSHLLLVLVAGALAAPGAVAHGALTLNEFDTYAISDFEGQEDSFPWEGFEIWDVYAGDGYNTALESPGVYFKANFAGDGNERPTGGAVWELTFDFKVAGESYTNKILHDGEVTSDFAMLDWQIADGNVFQVHAWALIPEAADAAITDLVVTSSVDGSPRDVAPGGFYDPATGMEVPFSAPPTVVFPAMGEGRIVDSVPLTGAAKFLDVTTSSDAPGSFTFDVTNPLAEQGQHFVVRVADSAQWTHEGAPSPASLDGGLTTTFTLAATPREADAVVEPLRVDLMSDVGGLQSYWIFADGAVQLTDNLDEAVTGALTDPVKPTPAPAVGALALLGAAAFLRRRD